MPTTRPDKTAQNRRSGKCIPSTNPKLNRINNPPADKVVERKATAGFKTLKKCIDPTPNNEATIPITAKNKGNCKRAILSTPNENSEDSFMVAAMAEEAIIAPQ